MTTPALFSADYPTARRRFRAGAVQLGWLLEAHTIDATTPTGEELAIDVAHSPVIEGHDTLVISSGLHGVEGFFGSAVQLGLLERWASGADATPALNLVLLHALNPFGFAWLRRVNEQNIDLNRNFLLPGESFAGSPEGYAALDRFLNPRTPPSRWEPFLPKALLAIARIGGMPRFKQAVAAGQYDYPEGLFYGGEAPSRAHRILAEHLQRWIGASARVVHLDFHTGLGKPGTWKLLLDYSPTDAQQRCLREWFGAGRFEVAHARGVAYQTRGSLGQWCRGTNSRTDYLYACAEFGTCNPIQVLASLRAENRAHHWCTPEDACTRHARQRLLEVFCPQADQWRKAVLGGAFGIVHSAIDGLTAA
jgi:hypothetical protein